MKAACPHPPFFRLVVSTAISIASMRIAVVSGAALRSLVVLGTSQSRGRGFAFLTGVVFYFCLISHQHVVQIAHMNSSPDSPTLRHERVWQNSPSRPTERRANSVSGLPIYIPLQNRDQQKAVLPRSLRCTENTRLHPRRKYVHVG